MVGHKATLEVTYIYLGKFLKATQVSCHNFHLQVKRVGLNIMTDSSPEKVYLPIPPPILYQDDPRAGLEESQQLIYDEVLKHFSQTDYSIPNVEKDELMDQEKFWLSRECILRYVLMLILNRPLKYLNPYLQVSSCFQVEACHSNQ